MYVCVSVRASACLSICLSACACVYVYVYMFVYVYMCLSMHICVWLNFQDFHRRVIPVGGLDEVILGDKLMEQLKEIVQYEKAR